MLIKITPHYTNDGPAEKLEFNKFVQGIQFLGYAVKLLHYTDGSILIEKQKIIPPVEKQE